MQTNEKPQHTPGPWIYDSTSGRIGTTSGTIVNLQNSTGWSGIGYNIPADEQQANARLIAAAPDMLEALTAYQDLIEARFTQTVRDLVPEWYETFKRAGDAIRKAQGAA